jgi:EpsD family peptidyl-prolyl cis-trans isomerase
VLALCSAVVAGCGVSEGRAPATLAARVNAEPITIQELEAERKRVDTPRGDALERLIEQRLARQHAIERGLDRTPQIQQALEAAKTDILAHAYRQLVAESLPRPTPEEIRRYYAEHPELFAQRRIYSLEEVTIARGREFANALHERAAKGEPLEAIARWLESLEARFAINRSTRAAEQLPLELLPRLHKMKEGEVHAIDHGPDGAVVVVRVIAARRSPLDEATATPLIEKFLLARRSSEALSAELKRLRKDARIEYLTGTP